MKQALLGAALVLTISSGNALAVTCTGGSTSKIYDTVYVNFDPASNTCNISSIAVKDDGYIIGGAENERVLGTYVSTGQALNLPDSLVVNGVLGTSNGAGVLFLNASIGSYLAVVLATLGGIQYRMEFNGEILGDASGPFGTSRMYSASVTASPIPIPAALPLFATGLGALGVIGWRRKREATG